MRPTAGAVGAGARGARQTLRPQLKRDSLGGGMATTQLRRVILVTLGLLAAGATFGAIAGVLTLGVGGTLSGHSAALDEPFLFVVAASFGAVLGAPLLPITGWLLLRRVPLGSAVLGVVLGTVLGGVLGWSAGVAGSDRVEGSLLVGAAGFVVAAVCLRVGYSRTASRPAPPPN